MESKKYKICVTVSGTVQGVGFRWFVRQEADRRAIPGFVKNLQDGNVYAEAEGTKSELTELIAIIKRGPYPSYVTDMNVTWSESNNEFYKFEIRH